MINMDLVEERGISDDTIKRIEYLQEERSKFLKEPEKYTSNPNKAHDCLLCIEYALQYAWGFPLDEAFHRSQTEIKGCVCERMEGSYGMIWTSGLCPYHGVDKADSWDDERFKDESM